MHTILENGRTTHRAVPTLINGRSKYEPFIDKEASWTTFNERSWLHELISGPSGKKSTLYGNEALGEICKVKSHKLAALKSSDDPSIYMTEDSFEVFSATVYFGDMQAMRVSIDTATDILVVQGSECSNCEGRTYDNRA